MFRDIRLTNSVGSLAGAYYAAQNGISLKAKSPGARAVLFELLAVLEKMKEEVGPSDAVAIESVSSAYVENFGLRIFAMADNEDRKGEATRSVIHQWTKFKILTYHIIHRGTAKKFLAAANFLEVLKIFPKTPISEAVRAPSPAHPFLRMVLIHAVQIEEKIKYAKWKAADIAKAFREGRKPTPGPAGSSEELESPSAAGPSSGSPYSTQNKLSPPSSEVLLPSNGHALTSSGGGRQSSPPPPPANGKISPKRLSPPPVMNAGDIARANLAPREFQPKTPSRPGASITDDVTSPGSWSTAATPGTDDRTKGHAGFYDDNDTPTKKFDNPKGGGSRLKNAWVSGELEGHSDEHDEVADGSASQKRSVRFTPSTGGLTPPVIGGPTQPFSSALEPQPPRPTPTSSDSAPATNHRRSSSLKMSSPPKRRLSLSSAQPKHSALASGVPPHVASTPLTQPSVPPAQYAPVPVYASPSAPPLPDPSPQDLTPQLIAKAQKHCRFAISALDYEDAEQARKELKAALAVLGG